MKRISILISAIALLVSSCGGPTTEGTVVKDSSKSIRYDDAVSISLCDGFVFDPSVCTPEAVEKAVSISPSVKFESSVSPDSTTLYLTPTAPLEYNRTYTVSGNFAKLAGVKGPAVKLQFKTLPPMARIDWSPLMIADSDSASGTSYYVCMTVSGADPLDAAYLEKRLFCPSDCKVAWTHSENGLEHVAEISGLKAGKNEYTVNVECSYGDYALSTSRKITVPKIDLFCVTGMEFRSEPNRYVFTFSEQLDAKQDFQSLVSMPGAGRLSFAADGNMLTVTPARVPEDVQEIHILKSVRSSSSRSLEEEYSNWFSIPSAEPSMRFISKGTILPSASAMNIYFESSNYRKVRVRCSRIYSNNVLQFLQTHRLGDRDAYLGYVGREVLDTLILLGSDDAALRSTASYGLNLSRMVKSNKGDIYKVEIGGVDPLADFKDDRYESDYYLGSWNDYADRTRNILVSDLAAIAKQGTDGEVRVIVTNIIDASAVSGASVSVYNDVNQLLSSGQTSSDGVFTCKISGDKPRTAIISKGSDRAYLSLMEGESISLSSFDVAGTSSKNGCKAFIFGERGVWRPGDEINLCFMAVPDKGTLPASHPVSVSLYNPLGQLVCTKTSNQGVDGMYLFTFSTAMSDPTGKWDAVFTMGGQDWHKTVRVETVKPNNIIADLKFAGDVVPSNPLKASLDAQWLVGGPAAGLEARIEAALSRGKTSFKGYQNYTFTDDSRDFEARTVDIAGGTTSSNGTMDINVPLELKNAPGFVNANITTRVFEKNGDFSTSVKSTLLSPYGRYIGIRIPMEKNGWDEEFLNINESHSMEIAAVDAYGKPVAGDVTVTVEIFKIGWNWWWTSSAERIAQFARESFTTPYKSFTRTVRDGKGSAKLDFRGSDSGFYYVKVRDGERGHSSSMAVMVCNDYESSSSSEMNSATCLPISADKEVYNVGETARLSIPSAEGARALVSLEKGGRILKTSWVDCVAGTTVVSIPLSSEMTPDVYASITLVQPYASTANDAPIRMFGVKRLNVEETATHIRPVISVPEKLAPESRVTVNVSEKDGRPMSFVLAMVDEGLLSITSFKTPDPWKSFFATEALGVRTWDLYNSVIGAYGARMEQMFAVGGDGEGNGLLNPENSVNRFPPMAVVKGPFTVKAHGRCSVDIDIPRYVGTVRVMAIATDGRNMGSTDKDVKVTKPVMVKLTLPRMVGTEDEIMVPVAVYATEDNAGSIKLNLSASGSLSPSDQVSQTVRMDKAGDRTVYFKMKASDIAGEAHVAVEARCAGDVSTDETDIQVREAGPEVSTSEAVVLEAGGSANVSVALPGRPGTNSLEFEASTIPSINLGRRLGYLTGYPHGCLEQTVSGAFPQLYLSNLVDLDPARKHVCAENVKKAIAALPSFEIPSGGFTTWPGTADRAGANTWAGIYAYQFMVEAGKLGYAIQPRLKNSAASYARKTASGGKTFSAASRAYACYVLALDGQADRSGMSRLREDRDKLSEEELLFLASAYAADGKKDVARQLCEGLSGADLRVDPFAESYPSSDRVLALRLMLSNSLGDESGAFKLASELAGRLNDRSRYMSTQATAWALMAMSSYARPQKKNAGIDVSAKCGGTLRELKGKCGLVSAEMPKADGTKASVELKNNSANVTYVLVSATGRSGRDAVAREEHGLGLRVDYSLPDGSAVDPKKLERGTDFVCTVYVTNKSLSDYRDIALCEMFPCGWEIRADRNDSKDLYQDWRDDRVYSYFDLAHDSTVKIAVRLVATYAGSYFQPAITAEAMYDGSVSATIPGFPVEVK